MTSKTAQSLMGAECSAAGRLERQYDRAAASKERYNAITESTAKAGTLSADKLSRMIVRRYKGGAGA